MGADERPPVAVWLATVASTKGPANPTVRGVLHALGTFMNGKGSTYVSLEALAVCTALHPRSVRRLIRSAEKGGWLVSTIERQGRRRAWRLKTYQATYPSGITPAGREDRMSSRQLQVRTGHARREDKTCNDVRAVRPSKSSLEISKENLQARSALQARAPLKAGPALPAHLAKRLAITRDGGAP